MREWVPHCHHARLLQYHTKLCVLKLWLILWPFFRCNIGHQHFFLSFMVALPFGVFHSVGRVSLGVPLPVALADHSMPLLEVPCENHLVCAVIAWG